jgi:hypothetical protein
VATADIRESAKTNAVDKDRMIMAEHLLDDILFESTKVNSRLYGKSTSPPSNVSQVFPTHRIGVLTGWL